MSSDSAFIVANGDVAFLIREKSLCLEYQTLDDFIPTFTKKQKATSGLTFFFNQMPHFVQRYCCLKSTSADLLVYKSGRAPHCTSAAPLFQVHAQARAGLFR